MTLICQYFIKEIQAYFMFADIGMTIYYILHVVDAETAYSKTAIVSQDQQNP